MVPFQHSIKAFNKTPNGNNVVHCRTKAHDITTALLLNPETFNVSQTKIDKRQETQISSSTPENTPVLLLEKVLRLIEEQKREIGF
jgi:coenzyme F420-reducing hydrogenase alpha subunit